MKLPHLFHRDPHWRLDAWGHLALYECRCGARRVRQYCLNRSGPIPPGWPQLVDSHGRAVNDSGWVR